MYLESWGNKKETRAWNRKNKNFPVDKKSAVYRKKKGEQIPRKINTKKIIHDHNDESNG